VAKINWIGTTYNHAVVVDAIYTVDGSLRVVDPWSGCSSAWYNYDSLKAGITIQSGSNGKYVKTWIVQ